MVYSQAQINAMNKQGAALLKAQQNNTYKPPVPTPAAPLTSYSNDYQAEINRRTAINPNDSSIATLSKLRSDKLASGYGSATSNAGYSLYDKPQTTTTPTGTGSQTLSTAPSTTASPTPTGIGGTTTDSSMTTIAGQPTGEIPIEIPIVEPPVDNMAQILAELKAAQLKATIAGLDKSLTNSLGNLDTEQAGLGQTYYDKRNQAAAQSDIGAMNFAQRAAARGISGSAGSMPDLYRNNALQGELGSLNRDEAGMNAGIERNRTNLRNNYESDVAGANAGIEAQSLQNYITQMNQDRQQANTDRTYAATQTNNERNSYMDVTGAYSNDYQAEINRLQNDGDSSNDWKIAYLQSERNKKIAEQKSIDEEITLARIKAGY